MKSDKIVLHLITYTKDGVGPLQYQIPAASRYDALVRLGQIHGDRVGASDKEIHILEIKP